MFAMRDILKYVFSYTIYSLFEFPFNFVNILHQFD